MFMGLENKINIFLFILGNEEGHTPLEPTGQSVWFNFVISFFDFFRNELNSSN